MNASWVKGAHMFELNLGTERVAATKGNIPDKLTDLLMTFVDVDGCWKRSVEKNMLHKLNTAGTVEELHFALVTESSFAGVQNYVAFLWESVLLENGFVVASRTSLHDKRKLCRKITANDNLPSKLCNTNSHVALSKNLAFLRNLYAK